jgi:hypothetical protein
MTSRRREMGGEIAIAERRARRVEREVINITFYAQ